MSDFTFGNIDTLKRNLDIEGEKGTELGIGAGITLIVLAASDANPQWKARGEEITAELNRLRNAKADNKRVRKYLAGIYAACIVKDWRGVVDADGNVIPFTVPACLAFLLQADDAYAAVDEVIYQTRNFRGARVEAIVGEMGNA